MAVLCSLQEFELEFNSLHQEALRTVTEIYPFMKIHSDGIRYQFDLKHLFSEPLELFSVDPSMVNDMFVINSIFSDESIHTDISMILSDLVQKGLDYEPVSEKGEFWMTFSDIRRWYGEEKFDKEMTNLFAEDYMLFRDYFSE